VARQRRNARSLVVLTGGLLASMWLLGPPAGAQRTVVECPGLMVNGRLFVPVRDLFEGIGYQVGWVPGEAAVVVNGAPGSLSLRAGSATATFRSWGGERTIALPEPCLERQDRLWGPARPMVEAFGLALDWVNDIVYRLGDAFELRIISDAPGPAGTDHGYQPPEAEEGPPLLLEAYPDPAHLVPQITMVSRAGQTITIALNGLDYADTIVLPAHGTVGPFDIPAGTYRYQATSPGVTPTAGTAEFDAYTVYTWTWSIVTRTYRVPR